MGGGGLVGVLGPAEPHPPHVFGGFFVGRHFVCASCSTALGGPCVGYPTQCLCPHP